MRKASAIALATAAVTAAQWIGGQRRPTPDQPRTAAWYFSLRKPGFTPPPPAFAVAWTGLSALLAYSGYRLLTRPSSPARARALTAWSANLVGIASFSWVLFGRKQLGEALGVTLGMATASATAAATASRVDRRAELATLPLVAWTGFAVLLQEEVWRRNRD